MAVYGVNHKGLTKRDTYDELIDYIKKNKDQLNYLVD